MKKYIVVEIGCIECGVKSQVAGVFNDYEKADEFADTLPTLRNGGQSEAKVFEIPELLEDNETKP